MTAQILAAELTGLISDTKRKLPDLRNVRDFSFNEPDSEIQSLAIADEPSSAACSTTECVIWISHQPLTPLPKLLSDCRNHS
jgi:hypothetical protein